MRLTTHQPGVVLSRSRSMARIPAPIFDATTGTLGTSLENTKLLIEHGTNYEGPWFWITNKHSRKEARDILYSHPVVSTLSSSVHTCFVTGSAPVYNAAVHKAKFSGGSVLSHGVYTDKSYSWEINNHNSESIRFDQPDVTISNSSGTNMLFRIVTFSVKMSLRDIIMSYLGKLGLIVSIRPIFNHLCPRLRPCRDWDIKIFQKDYRDVDRDALAVLNKFLQPAEDNRMINRTLTNDEPCCLSFPALPMEDWRVLPIHYCHRSFPETTDTVWTVQFATMKAMTDVHRALSDEYWVEVSNSRTLRIAHSTATRVKDIHSLVFPFGCPMRILKSDSIKNRYLYTTLTKCSTSITQWTYDNIVQFMYAEDAIKYFKYQATLKAVSEENPTIIFVDFDLDDEKIQEAMEFGEIFYAGNVSWLFVTEIDGSVPWEEFTSPDQTKSDTLLEILLKYSHMPVHTMSMLGEVCKIFSKSISKKFASQGFWQQKILNDLNFPLCDELTSILSMKNVGWGGVYKAFTNKTMMRRVTFEIIDIDFLITIFRLRSLVEDPIKGDEPKSFHTDISNFLRIAMSGDITKAFQSGIFDKESLESRFEFLQVQRPDLIEEYIGLVKPNAKKLVPSLLCSVYSPKMPSHGTIICGRGKKDRIKDDVWEYKDALAFSCLRDPITRESLLEGSGEISGNVLMMSVNLGYITLVEAFDKLNYLIKSSFSCTNLSPELYEKLRNTETERPTIAGHFEPRIARRDYVRYIDNIYKQRRMNRISFARNKQIDEQIALMKEGNIESFSFYPESPGTSQVILELVIDSKDMKRSMVKFSGGYAGEV